MYNIVALSELISLAPTSLLTPFLYLKPSPPREDRRQEKKERNFSEEKEVGNLKTSYLAHLQNSLVRCVYILLCLLLSVVGSQIKGMIREVLHR